MYDQNRPIFVPPKSYCSPASHNSWRLALSSSAVQQQALTPWMKERGTKGADEHNIKEEQEGRY
jgi:hypothetical protein